MADGRVIGKEAGHSAKVSNLSDFEHRVWIQTLCAPTSDDFGVMPASAFQVQAANSALEKRPTPKVKAALETICQSGLIRDFLHQGKRFFWHPRWQFWQGIKWPRATTYPAPPAADLEAHADEGTRELFRKHHARATKHSEGPEKYSGEPEKDLETSSTLARAGVASNPNPNSNPNPPEAPTPQKPTSPQDADGRYLNAGGAWRPVNPQQAAGGGGLIDGREQRNHGANHAACYPQRRLCVTRWVHADLVGLKGGDPKAADAWLRARYAETVAALGDTPVTKSADKFWREQFEGWMQGSRSSGPHVPSVEATRQLLYGDVDVKA